ncbi:putative quinol monooxygenase [Ancrocorticia populi]|uniref:putative quinol monooxygenase n=1 Tax=Ancrocorticia populi TaxID=2175228 RepID=UPI00235344BA|nr:putative quinol monooxygenase [Ancrocorticia populi]
MKVLYAEFTALDGMAEDVEWRLLEFAESVRNEPGNVTFAPHRRVNHPNRFFVYEVYRDEAAFQEHLAAPYQGPFNDFLAGAIEEPKSQLTFLNLLG